MQQCVHMFSMSGSEIKLSAKLCVLSVSPIFPLLRSAQRPLFLGVFFIFIKELTSAETKLFMTL